MEKRYAFWRRSDGRPYKDADDKYAPRAMLAAYGTESKLNDKNQLTWTLGRTEQILVGIRMGFVIVTENGEEMDGVDSWSIASKALNDECLALGGEKPIVSSRFLKRADALAEAFIRKPSEPYVLISSLSIRALPAKNIKIGDCEIRPLKSRKKYPVPPVVLEIPNSIFNAHIQKTRYCWVEVRTHGRSTNEAARRALTALSLLRAFWTLSTTYGRWSTSWGIGRPSPISAVHSGPIHTLHHLDGRLVNDLFWRDIDPAEDRSLFGPSKTWPELEKLRRSMVRRIACSPYRSEIEQLLVRYISSLDQTDHDVAFLQLWTILETITDTVSGRYDETVNRATWFLKDRVLGRELLNSVRIQRNRYVHAARSSEQADQPAYLLKSYLDLHLGSLIFNDYKVTSMDDYANLLAMPVDVATLEGLETRVAAALRTHKKCSRASITQILTDEFLVGEESIDGISIETELTPKMRYAVGDELEITFFHVV